MPGAIYAISMDLLSISVSSAALVLGTAIGWVIARSRFMRTIAELNSKLVIERRVNKQLSETVQVDAAPRLAQAPTSDEATHESMVLSG
jgi:hypothetical protein